MVGVDALTFNVNTMFVEKVKSLALSASTGFRNLAVSGQVTVTLDYPTQRNAPAFIEGSTNGFGPYYYMKTDFVGREAPGYYPLNVVQLQGGGTWQFGRLVGLSDMTLTGEALLAWNTNQPVRQRAERRAAGARRQLRPGLLGPAGLPCDPGPLANGIINKCDDRRVRDPVRAGLQAPGGDRLQPQPPGLALDPGRSPSTTTSPASRPTAPSSAAAGPTAPS